ncbi:MAG: conserved membrane protein of unknown function [Candidatus Thorarchaeota archaeon]|nr:MAG: conserved membrane protein of unknown function [Candidatus Thorarchaeota archaeon]
MSLENEIKTWFWVPKFWVPLYLLGLVLAILSPSLVMLSWAIPIIIVVAAAPIIYKNLVGGGCSLRFQICALVKGMVAGILFGGLSLLADMILQNTISLTTMSIVLGLEGVYLTWFFAGVIGGIGARIIEVQQYSTVGTIRPIVETKDH